LKIEKHVGDLEAEARQAENIHDVSDRSYCDARRQSALVSPMHFPLGLCILEEQAYSRSKMNKFSFVEEEKASC
jgi:hypothetical protein